MFIPAANKQAAFPRIVSETIQRCSTRKFNFELIMTKER